MASIDVVTIDQFKNSTIKYDASDGHTILASANGKVWSFGANYSGQLGLGLGLDLRFDDKNRKIITPTLIPNIDNIVCVACGDSYTILVKRDGTVWSFGNNYSGQLGLGDKNNRDIPTQIPNIDNVAEVACGSGHAILVKRDGTVWSFGHNYSGQLGLGDEIDKNIPTQIPNIDNVVGVACGGSYTILVKRDGTVWSFGNNYFGELGLGDSGFDTNRNTPTQIPNIDNVVGVACGGVHTILVKRDGTVWSFGFNNSGQLGLGDKNNRYRPTQILNINNIIGAACGGRHTALINKNREVYTFGENTHGQLGLSDRNDKNTPQLIPSLNNTIGIACGGLYTISIKMDGKVWACGDNGWGQLGLSDAGEILGERVYGEQEHHNTIIVDNPTEISNFVIGVTMTQRATLMWIREQMEGRSDLTLQDIPEEILKLISQEGGNNNIYYLKKYFKYKIKYLDFKKSRF